MDLLQAEIQRKRKLNAALRESTAAIGLTVTGGGIGIGIDGCTGSGSIGGGGGGMAHSTSSISGIKSKYIKQIDVIKLNEEIKLQAQLELDEQRKRKCEESSRALNLNHSSSSINVLVFNSSNNNRNSNSNSNSNSSSSNSSSSNSDNSGIDITTNVIASRTFMASSSTDANPSDSADVLQVVDTGIIKKLDKKNASGEIDAKEEEEDDEILDLSKAKFSQISGWPTEKIVYKYFKAVSRVWAADLDVRDDKDSIKFKMDLSAYKQLKSNVKPLFDLCKQKALDASLLEHLRQMVLFCEKCDFRSAHDWYLRAAIGNAPWPMGITMAGIHERSGREKISTSKVAHVMNSEMHRKFLTAVKRLMTYAQGKIPGIAPSMMMLN